MTGGVFVDMPKLLRPGAALVAADSDGNDISVLQTDGFVDNAAGLIHSEVADRIEDPIERDAEVAFAALTATFGAFQERREFLTTPVHDARRNVDLSMKDVLGVKLLHHAIRNELVIVGGPQALGYGLECQ